MVKNWRELGYMQPTGGGRAAPDGSDVLRGLEPGERPTVRLTYTEAGDLYVNWMWNHQPSKPRGSLIEWKHIEPVVDAYDAALPIPQPGESPYAALERALAGGALVDVAAEAALAERLRDSFVPYWLSVELNALEVAGFRPLIRLQLAPALGHVPWELMLTDDVHRGLDMFDLALTLPAGLRNDPGRHVSPWDPGAPVVTALDPVRQGTGRFGEVQLGSVLGPVAAGSQLSDMVAALGPRALPPVTAPEEAFGRDDRTASALAEESASAGRLLFVGHVTAGGHALGARAHTSDPEGLSAADIAFGTQPVWRAPNRVALVACDSGSDFRFAEPHGLVAAFSHRGAEYVTATRWPLPTDEGLRRLVPGLDDASGVLAGAVLAVNAAHEAADPVAALATWQRSPRERWTATGDPRYSPLVWAAFATTWSPEPVRLEG